MPSTGHDPATCRACEYESQPKDPPWRPDPNCKHEGDTWFNRSICAEPCGYMHDVCADCGAALGCYFNSDEFREHMADA